MRIVTLIAETSFCIRDWAAWLPGVETREEWQQWAEDQQLGTERAFALQQIPAAMRRRLSVLGKMVLSCAFRVVEHQANLPVIFCSQHGELLRSEALLGDIYEQEALSPNNFSMSVHNSSVGLYSIIANNHAAMSALSAGPQSFESGLIEAIAALEAHGAQEILLLIGDEAAGPYFSSLMDLAQPPYAMALLLSTTQGERIHCRFEDSPQSGPQDTALPSGLAFLRWLLSYRTELHMPMDSCRSVWWRGTENNT